MTEALPASLKPYARVRLATIRDDRFATLPIRYRRHPEVGGIAIIFDTLRRAKSSPHSSRWK